MSTLRSAVKMALFTVLTLLATGLRTRKDHIPFAPFLASGAVLAVLLGGPILDRYSR